MNCQHFRRAILADPHTIDAQMRLHLASCHDCTRYMAQVQRFEERLGRALRVDVDAPKKQAQPPRTLFSTRRWASARASRARLRRRWVAAAASLLLAVMVGGGLWLAFPGYSLAAAVVEHMAGEPNAWARTDVPVPQPMLDAVLRESHIRLKGDAGLVSYASSCAFRGHQVPHLVVQTAAGPVTVMVLTHESTKMRVHFDEDGYRGVIEGVPGHGSLAVLERGNAIGGAVIESVVRQVRNAIDWTA